MSPTIPLKFTIRRISQNSLQQEPAELQLTIPLKTLRRRPSTWKRMTPEEGYAGFTTVSRRERERQVQTQHELITRIETILWQFLSVVHVLSKPVRGNLSRRCHVKDNQEKVFSSERKRDSKEHQQVRNFFKNSSQSSNSGRTWCAIQTPWRGTYHDKFTWGAEKSITLRCKIRDDSAGNENRACLQFRTELEPTASFSRYGDVQKEAGK